MTFLAPSALVPCFILLRILHNAQENKARDERRWRENAKGMEV